MYSFVPFMSFPNWEWSMSAVIRPAVSILGSLQMRAQLFAAPNSVRKAPYSFLKYLPWLKSQREYCIKSTRVFVLSYDLGPATPFPARNGSPHLPSFYTAKTQCRNFETNIPRKGIARPLFQFPLSCVCERFIYSHNRSAYSAAGKYVDQSWEYINRSQTHECGN